MPNYLRPKFFERSPTESELPELVKIVDRERLIPILPELGVPALSRLALLCAKRTQRRSEGGWDSQPEARQLFSQFVVGHAVGLALQKAKGTPQEASIRRLLSRFDYGHLSHVWSTVVQGLPYIGIEDRLNFNPQTEKAFGRSFPAIAKDVRAKLSSRPINAAEVDERTEPVIVVRKKYAPYFQAPHWRNPTKHIESHPLVDETRYTDVYSDGLNGVDPTCVRVVPLGTKPGGTAPLDIITKRYPRLIHKTVGAKTEFQRTANALRHRVPTPKLIGTIVHGPNHYLLMEKDKGQSFDELSLPQNLSRELLDAGAKPNQLTPEYLMDKLKEAKSEFDRQLARAEQKGLKFGDSPKVNSLVHFSRKLKPIVKFIDFEFTTVPPVKRRR